MTFPPPLIPLFATSDHLIHEPTLNEPDEVHGDVERYGNEGVEQEGVVEELREEHPREVVRAAFEPEVNLGVLVLFYT